MRGFQVALEEHKMRPLFSVQLLVSFLATLNTQSNAIPAHWTAIYIVTSFWILYLQLD